MSEKNGSAYSRSKNGWYSINKKAYYLRSGWEVLYARYLDFLVAKGEILGWEYEADTFWYENIRRGVRSYTPDFKVVTKKGALEYHEVKGWMDAKSATKLKRMKKYYPGIKVIVIDGDAIKSIRQYERMFPDAIRIKKPSK